MGTQLPITGSSLTIIGASTPGTLAAVRPGDILAILMRAYGGDAVNGNHCNGCTFRNITVYSSAGVAAVNAIPTHASVFERVYSIPKPGTDRLISTLTSVQIEPDGPNNQIRLSRAIRTVDDGFAASGMLVGMVQTQVDSRTLNVTGNGGVSLIAYQSLVPNGSPVNFVRLADGVTVGSATIVSQTTPTTTQPIQVTYQFDRNLTSNLVGSAMYPADPSENGGGSVIERSTVQSLTKRARGMNLAGLANTTVRGNYISRSAFAGIHGEYNTTPGECVCAPLTNLNILNNVIDSTNVSPDWWWFELGAIQMVTLNGSYDFMTTSPFSNIQVTNNFVANAGRSAIWIGNTSGGSVTGNYLLNPNNRPDLGNADQRRIPEALAPLVIESTSGGIATSRNTIDTTSGRIWVTDTQFLELAAYAPGSTVRLSAYNLGVFSTPGITLTDADGTTMAVVIKAASTHAIDVTIPSSAALGGAYIMLTSGSTVYFGTLFLDSQDNISAVNGCTYETSLPSVSVPSGASGLPILVVTQPGCPWQVLATDAFVNPGSATTGTGVISVGFAANTGAMRSSTVEIAGQPITLTQAALSCDINFDGNTNVADVQIEINEALSIAPPTHDLNRDGAVNVADVQMIINAALGLGCGPH